jgi:hypothetical protein
MPYEYTPINIEGLLVLLDNVEINQSSNYIFSYPRLLHHFQKNCQNPISQDEIIVGFHMVYGWMPTTFNLKPSGNLNDALQNATRIIQSIQQNPVDVDFIDIERIKSLFNNSLVATSKFLHFLCPNQFPIWDSKICGNRVGAGHKYLVENIHFYQQYHQNCHLIIAQPEFQEIHTRIADLMGYAVSKVRAFEATLFY